VAALGLGSGPSRSAEVRFLMFWSYRRLLGSYILINIHRESGSKWATWLLECCKIADSLTDTKLVPRSRHVFIEVSKQ
jgi:hypothetical protein